MDKKNSVCTILVTYNRKELLIECLDGLLKQSLSVDAIYIIDNACTDGTEELLKDYGYIKKLPPHELKEPYESTITLEIEIPNGNIEKREIDIHYLRMNENTGGAGGFSEGIERAYSKGYDWFWIMDDDAEPKNDGLEKMAEYFDFENVAALSSSVLLPNNKLLLSTRGIFDFNNIFPVTQHYIKEDLYSNKYLEIDMASFVGVLVNRKAVSKIGFPKKEFFIHYDDTEYSIRLKEYGRILLIPESIIYHKEAAKKYDIKTLFGRNSPRMPYKQYWLSYYGKRNLVWIGKKYSKNIFKFYFKMILMYVRQIFAIILYDDNKLKRIKMVSSAFYSGLTGTFDNKKSKQILY